MGNVVIAAIVQRWVIMSEFIKLTGSPVTSYKNKEMWINKDLIQSISRDASGKGAIVVFDADDYIEVNESVEEILGIQNKGDNTLAVHILEQLKTKNPNCIFALNYAQNAIEYMERITKLHDCNDCLAKNDCNYAPRLGDFTRINCYGWVGK